MQGKRTNITRVTLEKIFKFGLSPIIFAISLFFALVIINYAVAVQKLDYDVTQYKTNSLSIESMKLLDQIKFEVKVKAFYTDAQQRRINFVLEQYKRNCKNITVEYIDPLKNPVVAGQYDITLPRTIIFEAPGKSTRLDPLSGSDSHGETEISMALFRLFTDQSKKIYFTTGHGEFNINDTNIRGLSVVRDHLIAQNYLLDTINILEEGMIPDDCQLLIIPGPTVTFLDEETEVVENYVGKGGSIFLMINPDYEANLDKIIKSHGILFGDNYIYETSQKMTTAMGGPIAPLVSALDYSEITASLPNQNFLFPFTRSVTRIPLLKDSNPVRLLATSSDSWAETDIASAKTVDTNVKPSRSRDEIKGPIPVAIITEFEFSLPDSLIRSAEKTQKVRSAFFGNASFITNNIVKPFQSNTNLFLNTVNWITRNENIIEITPHSYTFTPVNLSKSQRTFLVWFTLFIFPASILLVGIAVWYRRR